MLFTAVSASVGFIGTAGLLCTSLYGVLKIYSTMPPNLASGLRYLFDFTFALAEFILKLAYIIILFLVNILTNVFSSVTQFIPYIFKTFSSLLSLILWIFAQLLKGVFGMGDKGTNTLSWLFLLSAVYLYLDNKGYSLFARSTNDENMQENETVEQNQRARDTNTQRNDNIREPIIDDEPFEHRRIHGIGREQNRENNVNREWRIRENMRRLRLQPRQQYHYVRLENRQEPFINETNDRQHRPIHDIRREQNNENDTHHRAQRRIRNIMLGNRQQGTHAYQHVQAENEDDDIEQLEIENRENENEANFQEEADRTRMNEDNLRNIERDEHFSDNDDVGPRGVNNDASLCVICLDRERNVAVFPCGHTHLCLTCVDRLTNEDRPCPMCQRQIDEFRQIFV